MCITTRYTPLFQAMTSTKEYFFGLKNKSCYLLNEHSFITTMQDKKEQILDAALTLITERGFHDAPMSKLAKEAGVAAGTIYNYFDNKEDLIYTLYAHLKQKMGAALMEQDQHSQPVKERFFTFWESLYRFFVENPREFRFLEQYANSPFISESVRAENEHYYRPVIDFLALAQERGALRPINIDLLVALVHSNITATVRLALSDDFEITEQMVADAIQVSWEGLVATTDN